MEEKLDFEERPENNERKRALEYISKLIENARKLNKQDDLINLLEIQKLINRKNTD